MRALPSLAAALGVAPVLGIAAYAALCAAALWLAVRWARQALAGPPASRPEP